MFVRANALYPSKRPSILGKFANFRRISEFQFSNFGNRLWRPDYEKTSKRVTKKKIVKHKRSSTAPTIIPPRR